MFYANSCIKQNPHQRRDKEATREEGKSIFQSESKESVIRSTHTHKKERVHNIIDSVIWHKSHLFHAHWNCILSFLLFVLLPIAFVSFSFHFQCDCRFAFRTVVSQSQRLRYIYQTRLNGTNEKKSNWNFERNKCSEKKRSKNNQNPFYCIVNANRLSSFSLVFCVSEQHIY